jgi:hypothetical protein
VADLALGLWEKSPKFQDSGFVLSMPYADMMQIIGVLILNALSMVLLSLVLFALAAVLIRRVLPRFTREGIMSAL